MVGRRPNAEERTEFAKAIAYARKLQAERPDRVVVVLTDTRNRFARGLNYNGDSDTDVVTQRQLNELRNLAIGVPLATLLHPDAPFSEVRSYETTIPDCVGDKTKKVGRPKKKPATPPGTKKAVRVRYFDMAHRLFRKGMSMRQIAKRKSIPLSNVCRWLRMSYLLTAVD